MPDTSRDMRALKITVAIYAGIFALKIMAFLVTGVFALFAEAFHTLSDIIISGFLLVALAWSSKEADPGHLFGHGRAQAVAALVAATLFISFTAFKLYEESIPRLFEPHRVDYANLPTALFVIALSMVAAAIPFVNLLRQKDRGPAAKAQTRELVNDELGLIAALIGTVLIMMGEPMADPVASIVVATVIVYGAIGLLRENAMLVLGAAPGQEFMQKLRKAVFSVDGVLNIHDVQAEYVGPNAVHVVFHVEIKRGTAIEDADRISIEVHESVKSATGCRYCVVHVDPAGAPRLM